VREALRAGLIDLKQTLGELPRRKSLAAFLLANMIYTDGLVSLFAFAEFMPRHFGWHTIQIGSFGILLAIAGTFGAWLGGKLDDKLGPKRVISGSLLILLLSVIAILLVDKDRFCSSGSQRRCPAARCFPCGRSAPIWCWDS